MAVVADVADDKGRVGELFPSAVEVHPFGSMLYGVDYSLVVQIAVRPYFLQSVHAAEDRSEIVLLVTALQVHFA